MSCHLCLELNQEPLDEDTVVSVAHLDYCPVSYRFYLESNQEPLDQEEVTHLDSRPGEQDLLSSQRVVLRSLEFAEIERDR